MPLEVGRSAQPVPALVTAVHGTPQHYVGAPRVNAAELGSQFNSPGHNANFQSQQVHHQPRHSRQPSSETNHMSLNRPDVASGFESAASDSAGDMSAVSSLFPLTMNLNWKSIV